MRGRSPLFLATVIIGLGGVDWCQCPKDVSPPGVVQFQSEKGTRSLNVVVREVRFVTLGFSSVWEQDQVAASLVGFCFSENKKDDIEERIRYEFQRFGFFKVRTEAVTIEAPDSANPPTVSVIARVDEGAQFRLKGIAFSGNKAVTNPTALRNLFPIPDGDIFDRESVSKGLEDLRQAYGQLGFLNFVAVPETQIDEDSKLIALNIDFDEGRPFVIRSFTINGVDQQTEAALRALWPEMLQPGKVYNARLVKVFFEQVQDLLPGASPDKNLTIEQNARENRVDILLRTGSNVN